MTLVLACGYKRSGKDTLYYYLQRNSVELWDVYSKPGLGSKYLELFVPMDKCETSSAVIKEYYDESGIVVTDDNKEVYRSQLIRLAENRKLDDKYYWIRKCMVTGSRYISGFRFPYEYEFAKSLHSNVITVRIFRKEVPIPDEPQEHALDSFATDFVFISKGTTLDDLVRVFPQYPTYKLII